MLTVGQLKGKKIYLDDETKRILDRLKANRVERRLSFVRLGIRVEISASTLQSYESAKKRRYPTVWNFLSLADFFKWDVKKNINYFFACVMTQDKWYDWFMDNVMELGMSNRQLSAELKVSIGSVNVLMRGSSKATVSTFASLWLYLKDKGILSNG